MCLSCQGLLRIAEGVEGLSQLYGPCCWSLMNFLTFSSCFFFLNTFIYLLIWSSVEEKRVQAFPLGGSNCLEADESQSMANGGNRKGKLGSRECRIGGGKARGVSLCPAALITDGLVGPASCCFQTIRSAWKERHICRTEPADPSGLL